TENLPRRRLEQGQRVGAHAGALRGGQLLRRGLLGLLLRGESVGRGVEGRVLLLGLLLGGHDHLPVFGERVSYKSGYVSMGAAGRARRRAARSRRTAGSASSGSAA